MILSKEYKVIKSLGNQINRKFGTVHLVQNQMSGKDFVLKTINKKKANTEVVNRLRQEAQFNFQFNGLPEVNSIEEDEENIYLLKPFVSGEQIDFYWNSLRKRERFNFLKSFVHKLGPIFNHLDEKGIVHCDIKPSNILIKPIDDDFEVQLIDFGMAYKKDSRESRTIIFPLGYAAPELLLNRMDLVNQSTDLFALGILIWRLYAGELPLSHPNPSIFTNLQITYPLPQHSSVPKNLFPYLQKMTVKHQFKVPPNKMNSADVSNALYDAMNNRYQTIEEAIHDISTIPNKRWILPKNIFSKPDVKIKN